MTTMPMPALRPAPATSHVAAIELKSVWRAVMSLAIAVAGMLTLFVASMLIEAALRSGDPHARSTFFYSTDMASIMAIVALVMPFFVWRSEEPRRRFYHWAMPVRRSTHTLIKAAAGWVWLMAVAVLYLAAVFMLQAGLQHINGDTAPRWAHSAAPWEWLVPFGAATVMYLLVSAALIGSNMAVAWIVGVCAVYVIPLVFALNYHYDRLYHALDSIATGWYGFDAAAFGTLTPHMGFPYGPQPPSLSRWLVASALWMGIGLVLVVAVSLRHRDS
jgi:hypothetical protein